MAKSIKRNFLYNILLNISKVIFPLITAPYISRVLEPDGVGLFNFANTYANWFALFAALGIPYYGIREIAKIKNNVEMETKFVSEIISLSVFSTLLCTFVLLLSILLIPQLYENYIIFLVASLVLYFTPIRIEWFFSGKEEFGYITIRSIIIKTISVVLLFILVKSKNNLITYVVLYAVSVVANDIWNYIKLIKSGVKPYFTLAFRKHIKPLFILFSSNIAIYIYTVLDTIMLGFLCGYSEVGFYNCATQISKALTLIVTSLAAVALPRVTQYIKEDNLTEMNKLLSQSSSIVGFLSIPIVFGAISIAPVLVPLFFGEQFCGTIIPLQIIIITVIVVGYNNLTGIQILLGFGMDKYFLYSILAGTISSFSINLIIIPIYGAVGAAISSVIAEIIVLSVMSYYIFKYTPVCFFNVRETLVTVLISASFLFLSYLVLQIEHGWGGVFLALGSCSLIYLLAQHIVGNPVEKEIFRIISKRIKAIIMPNGLHENFDK